MVDPATRHLATAEPVPAATPSPSPGIAAAATAVTTAAPSAAGVPSGTPPRADQAGVPSGTPAVTSEPVPTASRVPTVPPQAQLEEGRWLQEIGDCDGASRDFASLAAAEDRAPAAEVAEARFRLAQCYLRNGAPTEAGVALTDLLSTAPADSPYRVPATFLLGEARAALGRWDSAVASYTQYLELAPEVAAYTWQRIAAVRSNAGNLIGATDAYSNALSMSPDWTTTVVIRRSLAAVLLEQNEGDRAAAQYDALRNGTTSGAWAAEMQWLAGSALEQAGDHAAAVERWQASIEADPTGRYAHQSLVALIDAGTPVDEYQRGFVDYNNDLYTLAIQAFDRVRAADPSGRQGLAWYYSALSYLALGQPENALPDLGNFIAAYPDSPLWNDAWLARARGQVRSGDTVGALATYRQFAAEHPNAAQAPTALAEAAAVQARQGDLASSAQAYLDAARRYPAADNAWQWYLTAGMNYFLNGDLGPAGRAWSEMAQSAAMPAWSKAVAYFWLAKAQSAAGETEAARRSWQQAEQADPGSYYSLRAADQLAGVGGSVFNLAPNVTLPDEAMLAPDRAAIANWLRGWAGNGSLDLPDSVRADPDWRRGDAFLSIGQGAAGETNWTRVQKRHAAEPWTLAALALAFYDAAEYPLAISSAEQLAALAPAGQEVPRALLQLAYPLPLARFVQEQAARWQVDPLLVASLIRQESRFELNATSSAAAQGLMQIIPDTAQWIATQLGWRSFQPKQIYWPYVNVQFGTYYLSRQLDTFDGSVALALAAYNGGPGNALRWQARSPNDEDLMVALIDLSESRMYVQLVYQNYQMYRELYVR